MSDLLRLPRVSTVCTLTCAGNRRYEHSRLRPVGGVQWEEGPIGNAEWTGVRLTDVLNLVGVQSAAEHLWMEGLDRVKDGDEVIHFGGSIPVSRLAEQPEEAAGVLLATHMNGEPLPVDHGFPLRAVVPGYIGARSVKWLGRITLSDRPSPNHFVADAYKMVETGAPVEWDEAAPIYRFPVNAAACSAEPDETQRARLHLRGYALPTGLPDCTIDQVDVSADGGRTWTAATVESGHKAYCWSLWSVDLTIADPDTEILVRAGDSTGHVQPETVAWNPKGYLYNAWHRLPVSRLIH